jgi:hypothetical protein
MHEDALQRSVRDWGIPVFVLAGLVAVIVALAYTYGWFAVQGYILSAAIGISVGMTEMMARYRDAPFATLRSTPGIAYFLINGGAAALAYYLIPPETAGTETLRILLAGISAMAFFRSGLFTVRLGENDVAVGPNLVLQIFLQALDRTYDRDRATPRSNAVALIMSGVSFTLAQTALPSLCFNLMQNASDDEQAGLKKEVEALAQDTMSDEAKALILGLALFNVVGEKTLRAAVNALGPSIKGTHTIDQTVILQMAKVPPQDVISSLPTICNELCDGGSRLADPASVTASILALPVTDESKAVLTVHALVRRYGEATVLLALTTLVK